MRAAVPASGVTLSVTTVNHQPSPAWAKPGPRSFTVALLLGMTRVLLAEDDTSISEPLSRALRREGYEVDVTTDGPTTLDRA